MYYDRPVDAVTAACPMVVDQVCYPDLPVAVDNDLIVHIDAVRSASYDRPLGLPGHCSTIAQASEAELELPSAVVDEARLVVPGVEDACSVGGDAEVAVGDVDRDCCWCCPS